MNYKINPTPRDFSRKKKSNKPYSLTKSNNVIFNKDPNNVWKVESVDEEKGELTLSRNGVTKTLQDKNLLNSYLGKNNSGSSKSKSDFEVVSEFGSGKLKKEYANAIAEKGQAEAAKATAEAKLAAGKATLEYENLEREIERARKRAEFPGKAKEAIGNFINDAAYYGHEHDTIMKAAKQIENEEPQFGDAQWVEDNKRRSKTNSQILKEATDLVYDATSLYNQQSTTYNHYLNLQNKIKAGNPKEKEEAQKEYDELYGIKNDKGEVTAYKEAPEAPKTTSNVLYDPSAAFKENKVAGAVGYTTGLLKVAPAVLDDTREFFKPGDVTYFQDKARRKLVQRYANRYKKLENEHKIKEERLERIKSTEINDATSRYDSTQSALKKHDEAVEANVKLAETQHQKAISDIQKDYGKKFDQANLRAGKPIPIINPESSISTSIREAAANKSDEILKARDKKIESQNKAYEAQKKDTETQNKNIRTRLEYDDKVAKENKESTEERAKEAYETNKAKAQDKLELKKDKLNAKYKSKMGEARFKDKEIENQMAFDKLKGSVQTTSDVAKAGLALVSKKARRKQIEEEGVDAVNARNARIAYALGDRSFQTRFAAGKVSPLNSLLHPIQSYKRHQINSNIKANRRNLGFSENPEITSYYSGEGWQERESEAIARLLDIDYSKLEEQQNFAELRPSQNYSQSLIGTEKLINNNNPSSSSAQTINSVVETSSIPNHLKETDVTKLNEVLEKSYYSPSPAEKFLQEKLSRGFSENEKIDTEYENMLEDIYQRASSSRIV